MFIIVQLIFQSKWYFLLNNGWTYFIQTKNTDLALSPLQMSLVMNHRVHCNYSVLKQYKRLLLEICLQFRPQMRFGHFIAHVIVALNKPHTQMSWYQFVIIVDTSVHSAFDCFYVFCMSSIST